MAGKVEAVWTRAERRAAIAEAEAARIAQVVARGSVPVEVGPEIPAAPGRGPVRMFEAMSPYPVGKEDFEFKPGGFLGRKTLQCADSFDLMEARARGAYTRALSRARRLGDELPVYVAPFSAGQRSMGRFYRDLNEKHVCAGVKCSSLEAQSGGNGGSGGDFMDAVLRDRQRLDLIRARIGGTSAMVVRRVRPSARGSRVSILDRRLVDAVCIEDATLTDVLSAHGWTAQASHIKALRLALCAALDRMMGPVRSGRVGVVRYGLERG